MLLFFNWIQNHHSKLILCDRLQLVANADRIIHRKTNSVHPLHNLKLRVALIDASHRRIKKYSTWFGCHNSKIVNSWHQKCIRTRCADGFISRNCRNMQFICKYYTYKRCAYSYIGRCGISLKYIPNAQRIYQQFAVFNANTPLLNS